MQRILMTADTVGGVWSYALELIRSLQKNEVEFGLATMGRPLGRAQRQQIRALHNLEVFESSYRLEWMEDPWRDVEDAGEWLRGLEREIRPDLVHLNEYSYASLPWEAPRLLVAHSDVYSWFSAVKKSSPPQEWNRYYQEVTRGLRSADLLVAPSRAVISDLQRCYGQDLAERASVIPNGRSPESFYESEKEKLVLTVGRLWDDAKNIQLLNQVAPDLSWPVYAAGSTRNADGRSVEIPGVQALGELGQQDLANWYARASIYVLPAKYEPFGLSILEAAMSGCALILGDIPSLRENWQHAAIFIDPGQPDALRDAVEYLIQNEDQRRQLASKARERSKFYSAKRMGAAYLHEYRQLIRPEPPISQEQYVRGA